jgi:3-oxoacyl-[acyl-carrier-protein] synthase III
MGIIIKSIGYSVNGNISSTVKHAKIATNNCMKGQDIKLEDIQLLINACSYRDKNIGEPAMASIIQKKLNLNKDPLKNISEDNLIQKSTFSFDVINGACGFLQGIQVASAFLKNQTFTNAIVITSNIHPSGKKNNSFPFLPNATATLLTYSAENNQGLGDIYVRTSDDDYTGIKGYLNVNTMGKKGRQTVTVEIDNDYLQKLKDFTIVHLKNFMQKNNVDLSKYKKIFITEPSGTFIDEISSLIGLDKSKFVSVYEKYKNAHSSAVPLALDYAMETNQFKKGDNLLFINTGSGLTVAIAEYIY